MYNFHTRNHAPIGSSWLKTISLCLIATRKSRVTIGGVITSLGSNSFDECPSLEGGVEGSRWITTNSRI